MLYKIGKHELGRRLGINQSQRAHAVRHVQRLHSKESTAAPLHESTLLEKPSQAKRQGTCRPRSGIGQTLHVHTSGPAAGLGRPNTQESSIPIKLIIKG
eukprot:jgi/Botrbrau1/18194/Bobra.53_1s0056.1